MIRVLLAGLLCTKGTSKRMLNALNPSCPFESEMPIRFAALISFQLMDMAWCLLNETITQTFKGR